MLHSPSFEISGELSDTANELGDKEACSRFDEIDGVTIGAIFDRVVLVLTQELESFIELESMTEDLCNREIVGANRERNSRTLRFRRFSGVELNMRRSKSVPFRIRDRVDKSSESHRAK
jgi:hypothetical protein